MQIFTLVLAVIGTQPGVVLPLLGPYPLGIATELPATGVALAHAPSSAVGAVAPAPAAAPPIAVDDLVERARSCAR